MSFLLTLLAVFLVVYFIFDLMGAREVAYVACKKECQKHDVVLLDESVAVKKTRIARNNKGHICFLRHFAFEFTNNVDQRYEGGVILCGRNLISIDMGVYRVVE